MAKIFARKTVIIDTGIVYALADKKDKWHNVSVDYINNFDGRLILPCTVIPEVCYLLNTYLGNAAEMVFLQAITDREFGLEHVTTSDLVRCLEILQTYADAKLGYVDTSLIAIAERLGVSSILTTDRRHFSLIRPKHCDRFVLLPYIAN